MERNRTEKHECLKVGKMAREIDSTMLKIFALHTADLGSILSITTPQHGQE